MPSRYLAPVEGSLIRDSSVIITMPGAQGDRGSLDSGTQQFPSVALLHGLGPLAPNWCTSEQNKQGKLTLLSRV